MARTSPPHKKTTLIARPWRGALPKVLQSRLTRKPNVCTIDAFQLRIQEEYYQKDRRKLIGLELPIGPPPRLFRVGVTVGGADHWKGAEERIRLLLVGHARDRVGVQYLTHAMEYLERSSFGGAYPQLIDQWDVDGVPLLLLSDHLEEFEPLTVEIWKGLGLEKVAYVLIQLALTLKGLHRTGHALGHVEVSDLMLRPDPLQVRFVQIGQLIPLRELEDNEDLLIEVAYKDMHSLGRLLLEAASERPTEEGLAVIREALDNPTVLVDHDLARPGLVQVLMGALVDDPDTAYVSMSQFIEGLLLLQTEMNKPIRIHTGVASSCGNFPMRRSNQDSTGYSETRVSYNSQVHHLGFYCLADGVGGEAAGELASQFAIQSALNGFHRVINYYDFETLHANVSAVARSLVKNAAQRLAIAGEEQPSVHQGATTFTGLFVAGDRAGVGHVGDSRVYLMRGDDLHVLTRDHNLANIKLAIGELSQDEALDSDEDRRHLSRYLDTTAEIPKAWIDGFHPRLYPNLVRLDAKIALQKLDAMAQQVPLDMPMGDLDAPIFAAEPVPPPDVSHLGLPELFLPPPVPELRVSLPEASVNVYSYDTEHEENARISYLQLQPGDRLILVSDGVYNELTPAQLQGLLKQHQDPDQAARSIISAVVSELTSDNIGVTVLNIDRSRSNL